MGSWSRGPEHAGTNIVDVHDPCECDPRGGRDSGGDPSLRDHLAVDGMRVHGQRERPGADVII